MHALNKSIGSPVFLVNPSASILFVGTHLTCACMCRQLSRMMTTSMHVRLSSMDVGDDGECKWSYKLLQSVTTIGGRLLSTFRQDRMSRGPSHISAKSNSTHSTVPVATDMAWLSAARVLLTARDKRKLFHAMGDQGASCPD